MNKKTLATIISTIGHPFALMAFLGIYGAYHNGFLQHDLIPILVAGVALLGMLIYLLLKKEDKEISNFDVSRRSQRPHVYLLGIAVLSMVLLIFYFSKQPKLQTLGILFVLILSIVASLVNTKIKMSLHTAFAFFGGIAMLTQNVILGIALLFFAFIIAWSRLALHRHTPKQLLVGGIVGILVGLGFYFTVTL